jgi:hypothetical protein
MMANDSHFCTPSKCFTASLTIRIIFSQNGIVQETRNLQAPQFLIYI